MFARVISDSDQIAISGSGKLNDTVCLNQDDRIGRLPAPLRIYAAAKSGRNARILYMSHAEATHT